MCLNGISKEKRNRKNMWKGWIMIGSTRLDEEDGEDEEEEENYQPMRFQYLKNFACRQTHNIIKVFIKINRLFKVALTMSKF